MLNGTGNPPEIEQQQKHIGHAESLTKLEFDQAAIQECAGEDGVCVMAEAAALVIRFDRGSATALVYDSDSFNRFFASLMLHHLAPDDKRAALGEVWRVLRPGGEFHVLDFGQAKNLPAHLISLVTRHMEETRELIAGRFPTML